MLFEFPIKQKGPWFVFGIATVALCAFFHIKDKDKKYSVEFLFSLALMIAGAVQTSHVPWLKLGYFPFFLALIAFYGRKTILSLLILIPFLELKNLLDMQGLIEEIGFLFFLTVTVGLSLLVRDKAEKKAGDGMPGREKELEGLGDSITETKSFYDEKVISDYLESMFKPDDEIHELLNVAKTAVFADSVNLFIGSGSGLKLRCSTDGARRDYTIGQRHHYPLL